MCSRVPKSLLHSPSLVTSLQEMNVETGLQAPAAPASYTTQAALGTKEPANPAAGSPFQERQLVPGRRCLF